MALASFIGNLLGPLVSSALMEVVSPWVPLLSAVALVPIGISTFIFIPETLQVKDSDGGDDSLQDSPSTMSSIKSHARHTLTQLLESFTMLKSPSLTVILLSFVVQLSLFFGKSNFFI